MLLPSVVSMVVSFWCWRRLRHGECRRWRCLCVDRIAALTLFCALLRADAARSTGPLAAFPSALVSLFAMSMTACAVGCDATTQVCLHCAFRYVGFWWMMAALAPGVSAHPASVVVLTVVYAAHCAALWRA